MPDTVRVNEALGIIEVDSFGEVSRNDIEQSIATIRQLFVEKDLSRILVDTRRQETMPSTTGIFDLFSNFPREFKLAVLVEPSQATEDDISFAETVGVNRGIRIKVFNELATARQWLDA